MSDWLNASELWKAEDDAARAQLAERFLAATTDEAYSKLAQEYMLLFGPFTSYATTEDVRSVCEVLRVARSMFALCHSEGQASFEDFHGCGLSPVFVGWGDAETPASEISPESFMVTFAYRVRGAAYLDWLNRSATLLRERSPLMDIMRISGEYLSSSSDSRGIEAYTTAHRDCDTILQQLFNLHLVDVGAECDGFTANSRLVAYSGVSLLWLGLSEVLSGGRAFRCEACGKPSVAYAERRKKKYCSDACRKWANAHPKQKREHWYIEQR